MSIKPGSFWGNVDTRNLGGGRFMTLAPFGYFTLARRAWNVPEGFITDFWSTPWFVWPFIPKTGAKNDAPAVVHDYLYAIQVTDQKYADNLLHEMCLAAGISKIRADAIYFGVRVGGWFAWWRNGKRVEQVRADLEAKYDGAEVGGWPWRAAPVAIPEAC